MISRIQAEKIKAMTKLFPVLALTGPRQSGKTTLLKACFPNYRYVSLENLQQRTFATQDPEGFLKHYDCFVIFDEVQRVPTLFSYLQEKVDATQLPGQFILSGSQNFLLLQSISQSLAGRVYLMDLLTLTFNEIRPYSSGEITEELIRGGYPKIVSTGMHPQDYFPSYVQTYVERDVRTLLNVQDLSKFKKFIFLLAHQVGQLFNASSLAVKLGVKPPTIQRWLSLLETSYIAFTLAPWHQNLAKRSIKTPKLYFYDTGLLCHILGIQSAENLTQSNYKGAIFENYVLLEILKHQKSNGIVTPLSFYRDHDQHEIDLIIERPEQIQLIEMKANLTVKSEHLKNLHYLDQKLTNISIEHTLVNFMEETQKRTNETILSWKDISTIVK
jgi:predicted AAA+ superfamily ATPase